MEKKIFKTKDDVFKLLNDRKIEFKEYSHK